MTVVIKIDLSTRCWFQDADAAATEPADAAGPLKSLSSPCPVRLATVTPPRAAVAEVTPVRLSRFPHSATGRVGFRATLLVWRCCLRSQ
jgi:hypothetical protein